MKPVVLLVAAAVGGAIANHPASAAVTPTVALSAAHPFRLQEPDGKALYSDLCKKCHGVLGSPPQTMKKKYSKIATFDQKFLVGRSEDSIVTILTKGKGEDMESIAKKASAAEIRAIAKYVRELAAKPKPGDQP